ncbi:uncharacterized protein LOC144109867 [Amblyomma americanum]
MPDVSSSEDLKKVLSDHLSPKPSVIGERAEFHRSCQREGESLSTYVAELRKLSQTWEFGSALDESLRDRFVCGLLREDVQRVLFREDGKLTFQKAVERAPAMEAAKKSAAEARGIDAVVDVHKMAIDGILVNMELDTGAAVSVMSKTQFCQLFPSAVLEPSTVQLRTYTGALVRPQGVSSVNVQHDDHSAILPLYVVDRKGRRLLGREWLHAVRMEWAKIWNLNNITRIGAKGISATTEKVDALLKAPHPEDRQQLQSFLGVNFYSKFLPNRRNVLTVHQGCIMFGMRVIVPEKLRNLLLNELHEGHPGIVRGK